MSKKKKLCKNCQLYIPNTKYWGYEDSDIPNGKHKCLAPTLDAQEYNFDYLEPEDECIHPSYFIEIEKKETKSKKSKFFKVFFWMVMGLLLISGSLFWIFVKLM